MTWFECAMFAITLFSGLTAVIEGEYINRSVAGRGVPLFWTGVAAIALFVALMAS